MSDDKQTAKPTAAVAKASDNHSISSVYAAMSAGDLQRAVDKQKKQREIINKFVADQLIAGTDFGTIGKKRSDGTGWQSKPTLFKPGQEKIFSLFGLTSVCQRDTETLEMLPGIKNLVAYKCVVFRSGKPIAEGRGAAVVGERDRDANSTIKIAEKRARMDACLSLGFSEFFTQDLEDPEYRNQDAAEAPAKSSVPATPKQKNLIIKLLKEKLALDDISEQLATIKAETGTEPSDLTAAEASAFIDRLLANQIAKPKPAADEEPTEPEPDPEVLQDVEVEVTPEYKDAVEAQVNSLAGYQRTKLLREATGKVSMPKTDDGWRALGEHLDKLAAGKVKK